MKAFLVIIARAAREIEQRPWIATSSAEAAEEAAGLYDEPCGITVREGGC
jgi:hypothetical protein